MNDSFFIFYLLDFRWPSARDFVDLTADLVTFIDINKQIVANWRKDVGEKGSDPFAKCVPLVFPIAVVMPPM